VGNCLFGQPSLTATSLVLGLEEIRKTYKGRPLIAQGPRKVACSILVLQRKARFYFRGIGGSGLSVSRKETPVIGWRDQEQINQRCRHEGKPVRRCNGMGVGVVHQVTKDKKFAV